MIRNTFLLIIAVAVGFMTSCTRASINGSQGSHPATQGSNPIPQPEATLSPEGKVVPGFALTSGGGVFKGTNAQKGTSITVIATVGEPGGVPSSGPGITQVPGVNQ